MGDPNVTSRWRWIAADVGLLVVVAALGLKAAYGVAAVRDADISDECY
jgi:hypothetical protein